MTTTTKTHRIVFKLKGVTAQLVDKKRADELIEFRKSPDYNAKAMLTFTDPLYQCEAGDIRAIEQLGDPQIKYGNRTCENEQCSSNNRVHGENERCEYDTTGNCEVCATPLWERDRSFSAMKFGRALCLEHSPLGKARQLWPGDDSKARLIQGAIAHWLHKGCGDEEAVAKGLQAVNRNSKDTKDFVARMSERREALVS